MLHKATYSGTAALSTALKPVCDGKLVGQLKSLMFLSARRHTPGISTLDIFTVAQHRADMSVGCCSNVITVLSGRL